MRFLESADRYGKPVRPDKDWAVVTAIGPTGNIYLLRQLNKEETDQLAQKLVDQAKIPMVAQADGPGRIQVWTPHGKFILPQQAKEVFPAHHPFLDEVTQDLIAICHHRFCGHFTILGLQHTGHSITFPMERGAHAGPSVEETSAFALLPVGILSGHAKPFIRPMDLRCAALKFRHNFIK